MANPTGSQVAGGWIMVLAFAAFGYAAHGWWGPSGAAVVLGVFLLLFGAALVGRKDD